MGTPLFAVPSLEILIKNNYEISAVVTVPDKKKGRGLQTSVSEVKKFSGEKNLNILQPDNLKDNEFIKTLTSINPDLIIVVAFRILPKEIYTIPKFGSINLHASLLPKFRGAAPINRAIINGEKESGVTTFFLKDKVDTGNIIIQKKINIEDDDDAGSLSQKLSHTGAECVLETVRLIENQNVTLTGQDNNLASSAPKIFKEDCKINWNQNAITVHNFIRGLSPYPAAFSVLENKSVKIFKTKLTDINDINEINEINETKEIKSAGILFCQDKKLLVSVSDGLLEILELQLEGKKRISANDYINGIDRSKEILGSM